LERQTVTPPEQACAALLRNVDAWQPAKVPATTADRDAVRRLFESSDSNVSRADTCGLPKKFVERWLLEGDRVDTAALLVGDDEQQQPDLIYLPTRLCQSICRSVGVWIDGEHNTSRTIKVQLKQTPTRNAVLSVPKNTICSDILLRSCATMCERVTGRHLERLDGTRLRDDASVGVELRDVFATTNANTAGVACTIVVADDPGRSADRDAIIDEEASLTACAQMLLRCGESVAHLSKAAAAHEQALLANAAVTRDARAEIARAQTLV